MKSIYIFMVLLLLLLPASELLAAQRALFMLDNFLHSLDLNYKYDGQHYSGERSNSSSSRHRFDERYHLAFDYAVYNSRILKGSIAAELGPNQEWISDSQSGSNDSTGIDLLYKVTGIAFERSHAPVAFFALSDRTHVQREFSGGYDLQTDSYGVGLSLKNEMLPAQLDYTRSESETEGFGNDRITVSENASLHLANSFKRSLTELTLLKADNWSEVVGDGSGLREKRFDVSLRNFIAWEKEYLKRNVDTVLRYSDEDGINSQKTLDFSESVTWEMGRALATGLNYSFSDREYSLGDQKTNVGRAWLRHRFVESLTTFLDLSVRKDELVFGDQQDATAGLHLAYVKRLPNDSSLQLQYAVIHSITDRQLQNPRIPVPEELHVVTDRFRNIPLRNPNVIPDSVVVADAATLLRYIEGTDYELRQLGLVTEIVILPDGAIDTGDQLLVSYIFAVNPDIEYSTNSQRIAASLSLYSNKYRIYASWDGSEQDLLDGEAELVRLTSQNIYHLGADANLRRLTATASYTNFDSKEDRHQSVECLLRTTRPLGKGVLSAYLGDRLTLIEPNALTDPEASDQTENSFTAGGSYSRNLLGYVLMTARGNYMKVSGDTTERDDIALGLNLGWTYGKMTFSLLSQVTWRNAGEATSRDEHVRLQVTRRF